MQSDLIDAIRSIRDEWNIDENIRKASDDLRERELKRVQAEIEEASLEARRILEEARRQADNLISEGQARAQNLKQEKEKELKAQRQEFEALMARREEEIAGLKKRAEEQVASGREEGHRQGYDEGYQEGMEKFRQMAEELGSVLCVAKQKVDDTLLEQVPGFQSFVMAYIQKLVGVLAEHTADCVLNNVSRAAKELSRAARVKVVVSEQDYDALMIMEDELRKSFPPTARIELIRDAGMQPGGCLLESELGSVDATIEGQMELLHQELMHE